MIQAFIKTVSNLDVAMVSGTTVGAYKKSMLKEKREATTINDHMSILSGFFEYCISNIPAMAGDLQGVAAAG